MTVLVSILLAQTAPAALSAAPSDDIVVVGERLKQMRRLHIRTKIDRKTGVTRCVFKRRSGDARLDAAVCAATLACVAKVATEAEIAPCMQPAMDALVRATPWSASAVKQGR